MSDSPDDVLARWQAEDALLRARHAQRAAAPLP
jgi:hypothetical protein